MEIPRGSLDTAPLIDLNIAREEQSNDYVNRKQQQQQSILLYRILFGVVGCCFAALYCAMGLLNLLTQRTHLLPKQYDLPLCSVIHFIATLSILSDKDLTLGTENSRSKKQSSQPKAI
ncbi:hypothetical protein BLNAU_267 [Blattamonas nauphoetae]|uniref:Uncharacterized protein n=1 Tax=Blattamonas nauphoetae TaxID=2049346 RepID=A0ABQ9YMH4_9EUKA|nr:hypothetical protein BLNAU_267 [Blattamonas nauphoetae]